MTTTRPDSCAYCRSPMSPAATGRPRRTCSDRCRQALRRRRDAPRRVERQITARQWRSADTHLRLLERYSAPIPDPTVRTRLLIRLSRGIELPWCPVCKQPFLRELGVRGHCSRQCSAEARRRAETLSRALVEWAGRYDPVVDVRVRLNLPIKTCAQCDRPFNDYIRKKRYCSDRCRARAWRERRRMRKTCPHCRSRFLPHHPHQQYCSRRCKRNHQTRVYHARKHPPAPAKRRCLECDRTFHTDKKNAWKHRYCSNRCVKRAWRRSQKRSRQNASKSYTNP